MLTKAKLALTLSTLILFTGWAVPEEGAAHSFHLQPSRKTAARNGSPVALVPIRLRVDRTAGLLVSGWINDAGPYTFVIDTGAGVSILSSRVAREARLHTTRARHSMLGGLSRSPITANEAASADQIALGVKHNSVPGKPTFAIVQTLPGTIDGILDPSELLSPLAYSIDLPNRQLLAFESESNGLDLRSSPKEGTTVQWVREAGSNRPFVRLADGRLALIDTGSGLGLAVSDSRRRKTRNSKANINDLGGGSVESRQLAPTTIKIGGLELRSVPTDLLLGVPAGTPVILGRRALDPFKITFDPTLRLIAFETALRR